MADGDNIPDALNYYKDGDCLHILAGEYLGGDAVGNKDMRMVVHGGVRIMTESLLCSDVEFQKGAFVRVNTISAPEEAIKIAPGADVQCNEPLLFAQPARIAFKGGTITVTSGGALSEGERIQVTHEGGRVEEVDGQVAAFSGVTELGIKDGADEVLHVTATPGKTASLERSPDGKIAVTNGTVFVGSQIIGAGQDLRGTPAERFFHAAESPGR